MEQMSDMREGKGEVAGEGGENCLRYGIVLREGGGEVFGFAALGVADELGEGGIGRVGNGGADGASTAQPEQRSSTVVPLGSSRRWPTSTSPSASP